jgi:hypothetical protein
LSDNFGYGFLQIPHWLSATVYSLVGQQMIVSSGTLAFAYTLPPFRPVSGLSPVSYRPCRSHLSALRAGFLNSVILKPTFSSPTPSCLPRACGDPCSVQPSVSTAPLQDPKNKTFKIIHPFHPSKNNEFEIYSIKKNPCGEKRVYFYNLEGRISSVPLNWTDVALPDPFVHVSAGRSLFRIEDLLRLVYLVDEIKKGKADDGTS